MNRSTKFINDIFIYAIGNLGSKLITFLLVPLYTYYISPDDFGYYDIVLTLTFLAMGFITFQLRDGTFRFCSIMKTNILVKESFRFPIN